MRFVANPIFVLYLLHIQRPLRVFFWLHWPLLLLAGFSLACSKWGCSLLWCWGFSSWSSLARARALAHRLSSCGTRAVAPRHLETSQTRDWTSPPALVGGLSYPLAPEASVILWFYRLLPEPHLRSSWFALTCRSSGCPLLLSWHLTLVFTRSQWLRQFLTHAGA